MQGNKGKDTGPELLLRKALWAAGVRGYRLHRRVEGIRPDLVFGKAKVAVFVHGCFWHRCPHCTPSLPKNNRGFWRSKFSANRARDARKRAALESLGWQVVEIWECQLHSTLRRSVDVLIDVVSGAN